MKIFLFILFAFSAVASPQVQSESGNNTSQKTNLEIFYILTDSSASNLLNFLGDSSKEVSMKLNLGSDYSILGNQVISSLQKKGIVLSSSFNTAKEISSAGKDPVQVNFVIDNAVVKYGGMFRESFLGDYYIPRNISLSGNFMIESADVKYNSFSFSYADSVRVDELKKMENSSFPFTQGDIPAEPFFSGLLEPVVAIGTAAVAVFLFFTIRSK